MTLRNAFADLSVETTQVSILGTLTDGSQVASPVKPTGGSISRRAASTASTTLAAANTARRGLLVYSEPGSAVLYLNLVGGTASATSYSVQLNPGDFYEVAPPVTTAAITGTWASATGYAMVTEIT